MNQIWNQIEELESVASPGLLVNVDCVARNIDSMVRIVDGDTGRLRPHVKTHKMPAVIQMQLDAGIGKFKASTIAEASMVAGAGGQDVLLAYPVVGLNIQRLADLRDQYPETCFSVLVDHPSAISMLAEAFPKRDKPLRVFIDVDCGMHRTGIPWGEGLDQLRDRIDQSGDLEFAGLHVYDGHLHQPSLDERQQAVTEIRQKIADYATRSGAPEIVAGGSPTFAFWAQQPGIHCSPGTTVFWDIGYAEKFPDLPFEIAAALLTRVISKPGNERICLDLGYKAIASEMPFERRLKIASIEDAKLVSHSEEHLVLETASADSLAVGQPLIAFPRHICPTVALHSSAHLIRDSAITGQQWSVTARNRTMPTENTPPSDPPFRSSLRELKWIIAIWLFNFVWVITYCWLFGYSPDQPIALTFGIPSWAFWGIFAPWGVATAVSCWFALTQMQDHPLDVDDTDEQTEATDA